MFHRMNDTGKQISILKLDVEGFEFRVLHSIQENVEYIKQLTLELHENKSWEDKKAMLDVWKVLHSKSFRIINYSPNLTMERWSLRSDKNYHNFDITLSQH